MVSRVAEISFLVCKFYGLEKEQLISPSEQCSTLRNKMLQEPHVCFRRTLRRVYRGGAEIKFSFYYQPPGILKIFRDPDFFEILLKNLSSRKWQFGKSSNLKGFWFNSWELTPIARSPHQQWIRLVKIPGAAVSQKSTRNLNCPCVGAPKFFKLNSKLTN